MVTSLPTGDGQDGPSRRPSFPEIEITGIRLEQRSNAPLGRPLDQPDSDFTDSSDDQPVLLVKEKQGERFVPIWVRAAEATAIAYAQQSQAFARPRTHDLMRDILQALEIRLLKVTFTALRDGVLGAQLLLSDGSTVASRPSDAAALALQMRAPMYMAQEILTDHGVEIPGEPASEPATSELAAEPANDGPRPITELGPSATTVELEVVGIRIEMPDNEPLILMKEKRGQRHLPIRIGPVEATAIAFYQQRMTFARPQTHDLMRDILKAINVRLVSATLAALRDGIYYTDLRFSDGSIVSSRPSDAVALVVRTGAQLLVTTGILDEAGVTTIPSP